MPVSTALRAQPVTLHLGRRAPSHANHSISYQSTNIQQGRVAHSQILGAIVVYFSLPNRDPIGSVFQIIQSQMSQK